jgi:adenylate kinase family enzyme
VHRVWVVGNSGSGKTTVARALARRLGVSHLELDAINHQPGWVPLELDEFRRRVRDVVDGDTWVVDGNYRAVGDLLWDRADTVVWLDLGRATVMRQVVGRTVRRVVRRQELWNGNRERWQSFMSLDPMESVIVWAWTNHDKYVARYTELEVRAQERGTRFIRLRSRAEARAFVTGARAP